MTYTFNSFTLALRMPSKNKFANFRAYFRVSLMSMGYEYNYLRCTIIIRFFIELSRSDRDKNVQKLCGDRPTISAISVQTLQCFLDYRAKPVRIELATDRSTRKFSTY